MLTFSSVYGYVKSRSFTRLDAKIVLDENDPMPKSTMEEAIKLIYANKQDELPLGILKTSDIANWLHKSGVSVNVKTS